MGKLSGRIAVVTGAASGIGRGCAELFASEGATVVVADLQEEAGREIAEAIGGSFEHVDVGEPASVEAMIGHAAERHGRIDILMNNAGRT